MSGRPKLSLAQYRSDNPPGRDWPQIADFLPENGGPPAAAIMFTGEGMRVEFAAPRSLIHSRRWRSIVSVGGARATRTCEERRM